MATTKYPPAYPELNALLHTVRCIQQHETQLCTLLQGLKTSGKLTAPLRKELLALLAMMPTAHSYATDLEAVEQQLTQP